MKSQKKRKQKTNLPRNLRINLQRKKVRSQSLRKSLKFKQISKKERVKRMTRKVKSRKVHSLGISLSSNNLKRPQ
jgi:hypothetical protein